MEKALKDMVDYMEEMREFDWAFQHIMTSPDRDELLRELCRRLRENDNSTNAVVKDEADLIAPVEIDDPVEDDDPEIYVDTGSLAGIVGMQFFDDLRKFTNEFMSTIGNNNFEYINSLGRSYDDSQEVINEVEFRLTWYGKHKQTIQFSYLVTEKRAIEEAEQYLSGPITKGYYNRIKRGALSLEFLNQNGYKKRGDFLDGHREIKSTHIDANGTLTLITIGI